LEIKQEEIETFQSTHPTRGATVYVLPIFHFNVISIHAPYAGCDKLFRYHKFHVCDFNPRTLRGVRHMGINVSTIYEYISIHAPYAGCDNCPSVRKTVFERFQSTHPTRGATCGQNRFACCACYFNPRTLRGVRRCKFGYSRNTDTFQSTHPTRGATLTTMTHQTNLLNFNPRTLRGVRLPK